MKLFAKDVKAPEALAIDGSKAETSNEVNTFYISIVTTRKMLDQGTP